MRFAAALVAIITFAGCARQRPVEVARTSPDVGLVTSPPVVETPTPGARELWQITMLGVSSMVARGEFVAADTTLTAFAGRHDGTCIAAEAGYARALIKLAPTNNGGSASDAVSLLDGYLASTCLPQGRVAEARLVRKVAADLAQREAANGASAEEIRKLREQLEQTKKELDRLKLRVIPPP